MASQNETNAVVIPTRRLSIDFWVGLFALAGILAFAYLAVNIARINLFNTGFYELKATFDNISGLKIGAPVEIAGVQIGSVGKVELDGTSAVLTLHIQNGIHLRDDDIAAVRTKGIIGDRYIKIAPGGSATLIKVGGDIRDTESVLEFEDIIGKFIHKME